MCAPGVVMAFTWLGLLVWSGACYRTSPPAGLPPRVPAPPSEVAVAAPRAWDVARPSEPIAYTIETHAIIASRADTLARVDTVSSRGELSAIPRGAALDVTVSVYVVSTPSAELASLPGPIRILGRFDDAGGISFQGAGLDECSTLAATAAEATRDLWARVPARVRVGDVWRDSATVSLCRDGVPLTSTLVRDYRVLAVADDDSAAVLTLARRSRVQVEGAGAIRGEAVTIRARGSGEATLRWSAREGWLLEGEGRSQLVLEAESAGRTQTVEQQLTFTARATSRF